MASQKFDVATGIEECSFEALRWQLHLHEWQNKSDFPQIATCCDLWLERVIFSGTEISIMEFLHPPPTRYFNTYFFTGLHEFHLPLHCERKGFTYLMFLSTCCLYTGTGIYESEVCSEPVLEEGVQLNFQGQDRENFLFPNMEGSVLHSRIPSMTLSFQKKGPSLKRFLNRRVFDAKQTENILTLISPKKINLQWALTFNKVACSIPGHRRSWEKLQTANTIAG